MSELKVQSEWMVNPLYHLDGTEQIRRLDALLPIAKLKVIQWTCVEGQPSPLQYISVLMMIQETGKCLLKWIKPEELEPIMAG